MIDGRSVFVKQILDEVRAAGRKLSPKVWLASVPIGRLSMLVCHKSSMSFRWFHSSVSPGRP